MMLQATTASRQNFMLTVCCLRLQAPPRRVTIIMLMANIYIGALIAIYRLVILMVMVVLMINDDDRGSKFNAF